MTENDTVNNKYDENGEPLVELVHKTQAELVTELLDVIQLEKLEDNLYRGISRDFVGKRVFGGQVLAQALMAASLTTDRPCHSIHSYFLRGGDINAPIVYQVEHLRDGRSIQSRQVKAIQFGKVIFSAIASFADFEEGLNYQTDEPSHPAADTLPNEQTIKKNIEAMVPEKMRARFMRQRHIEITPVKVRNIFAPKVQEPEQAVWLRVDDEAKLLPALEEDYRVHQAILAFTTDFMLLGTSLLPHGISFISEPKLQAATIDHTIHFHRPLDVSQWYLHDMYCDVTSSTRGLNHGKIWQDGKLVVSTQQESLIRVRKDK